MGIKNIKNSGIYLVEFNTGVKVGIGKNCLERIRSAYMSPWCLTIFRAEYLPVQYSKNIEAIVKRKYKDYVREYSHEYFVGISYEELKEYITTLRMFKPDGMTKIDRRYKGFDWIILKNKEVDLLK